ncbi:MAG: DNA replication/repair protein RecF [Oscillospiraceae bacterium]|nr:DNA replication/repair protein RecF [Oscillospiraceae bacterium]
MRIDTLFLENYRNVKEASLTFSPGINVICGENAQGKTNILEACAYMALPKSFRTRKESELIGFGGEFTVIRSSVWGVEGRKMELEARLFADRRRKQLFVNGVKKRGGPEFSGIIRCVLFCPEDLYIIKDGASGRRSFLDACICQLRPRYAAALEEYTRLYEHKLRILRDWEQNPGLLDALDDFSVRMAQTGAIIISYRARFIKKLGEAARRIHGEISGGREELTLKYSTVSTVTDPLGSPEEIYPALTDHWRSHRQAEISSGSVLSGPHKDELEVYLNGLPVKSFGSQGQIRTAALSLKLAERQIHFDDCGKYPVLLLDDVLSELDSLRRDYVLNKISTGQVIITCCGGEWAGASGKLFSVSGGEVREG